MKREPKVVTKKIETHDLTEPTPLEVRLAEAPSRLNRSRRHLITSIMAGAGECVFLSSRQLAKRYRVDSGTVARTVRALGYDGYAAFQDDLREYFFARINPYRLPHPGAEQRQSPADRVSSNLQKDIENLILLQATLDTERIVSLANQIYGSRQIQIIGLDFAASLALYLAYALSGLGFEAHSPLGSPGNLRHRVASLSNKDLLIAISFGRCLRETVNAVERARKGAVPTFGITDSSVTPLAIACDDHLVASISTLSYTGSYVAPVAALNAIIMACANIDPKRSLARLRQTEDDHGPGSRWCDPPGRQAPRVIDQGRNQECDS